MLNQTLVVARKELVDAGRDVRSLISALMYALMGPVVVFLVSLSVHTGAVIAGMMSVFTLVAAFVGGMNVAMDTIAGERERRSLLPLLLNPVERRDLVMGKWLAVSVFAIAGLAINIGCSMAVLKNNGAGLPLAVILGAVPLALLAASLQLLISTLCRSGKEAQTYLSMLVFAPMGVGMFLVFHPAARGWAQVVPLMGQQMQLEALMSGHASGLGAAAALGVCTCALALAAALLAGKRFNTDAIIYGS